MSNANTLSTGSSSVPDGLRTMGGIYWLYLQVMCAFLVNYREILPSVTRNLISNGYQYKNNKVISVAQSQSRCAEH